MSFTFSCEFCRQTLKAEDEFAGQQANCPACGKRITVPVFVRNEMEEKRQPDDAVGSDKKGKQAEMICKRGEEVQKQKKLIIRMIRNGRYEGAFKFVQNSYCTHEDILEFLLEISYRDHDFQLALEYAEKLIERCPGSSVGYRWKAEILDDGFGKMEESIRLSTKAIELNPKDAQAYTIRGNTKRWMNPSDREGAMADYLKAIEIDETCPSAYSGIGWLTLNDANDSQEKPQTMLENARKMFATSLKKAEEKDELNYGAFQGIAAVLTAQGKPEKEFMPALEKAIKLSPKFPYAYIQRATAKLRRDNPPLDEIIQDFARAIAFSIDFSKINEGWLKILRELLVIYCKN